jgi:hypothetical protein
MITLHEVKGRRNKTIASYESPDMLMVSMGFTLDETRRLIDVAAQTADGVVPPETDLVTRKYFITFDDSYLRNLGVATTLDGHGSLDDSQIADITGLSQDHVVKIRKGALEKLKQAGELRAFAELIAELAAARDDYHQFEIVENTEITIKIS